MKVVILIIMMLLFNNGYGQNNQIKLYIQQIAANKVYVEYLQKGYSIVKNGLRAIGDIKDGHWRLDMIFFDGLEKINPKVRQYAKVADIIALNIQVIKRGKKLVLEIKDADVFTEREALYAAKVVDRILVNCAALIDELGSLLKTSELKMSDDERIKRIDGLYEQMRSNYSFVNYFSGEWQLLQLQKSKALGDGIIAKQLLND
ncbi:MAG: hypothetical protein QM763_09370 [Agriterribacter sp.]